MLTTHMVRPRALAFLLRPQQQLLQFSSTTQPQYVTAPAFATLMRKSGLSVKALHRLDAAAQETRARDGGDAFPIAVALSGGADSMALTLLLREHLRRQQIHTPLLAITVDHRLRPESTQEAADVGRLVSERWGITHVVAQCEWSGESPESVVEADKRPAKPRGSKLQEEARRYRYSLLHEICREKRVKYLFVAHNLGDQLETVLFRLGRASGINGLAGIASVSTLQSLASSGDSDSDERSTGGDEDDGGATEDSELDACVRLVRPLLSIPKAQLKETCRRFRQEWVEDPSNEKLLFDRIRIRKVRRLLVELSGVRSVNCVSVGIRTHSLLVRACSGVGASRVGARTRAAAALLAVPAERGESQAGVRACWYESKRASCA